MSGAAVAAGLAAGRRSRRRILVEYRLARAGEAVRSGSLAEAAVLVDELLRSHPADVRALNLRRELAHIRGEITTEARLYHRLHVRRPTPVRLHRERRALGRLIETTPGWYPRVPGSAPPAIPPDENVVLHLLKESLPYLTNGFTMRSRYNLLAARDAGIRPVVVTSLGFPRLLGIDRVDPVEIVDGIPHHRLDLGPHLPGGMPFDEVLQIQAWQTARIAQVVRPALIHASSGHRGYETALVGLAVAAHAGRPLVYEVRSLFEATWSGDLRHDGSGEYFDRRFRAETAAMLAADHVLTISGAMRANIVERGVPPDRVTVLPNGVDVDGFVPAPPDPILRRRYGLEGAFTFGYVSNLDHPRENQELLIEATRILAGRGRRVKCLIVGDGRRRAELERAAAAARLGDRVVFTGRIPHADVARHYALLDAFVVPRRDEWASRSVTPLKPFEAMAMARPLVVADLPALTEIAEPGVRGIAFRPEDGGALADSLEALIDDPGLGARLGAAGREWVAGARTWSANGPLLRDVYADVLERWAARERTA